MFKPRTDNVGKFCSRICYYAHQKIYFNGKNNNRFGKKHSESSIKKMRASQFRGGITRAVLGYIWVLDRDHPRANHGYVYQHRAVMEKHLGRYLYPGETVHHLGEKDDNRLSMLMVFSSHSAHLRFHKNPANVKAEEIVFDGRNYCNVS